MAKALPFEAQCLKYSEHAKRMHRPFLRYLVARRRAVRAEGDKISTCGQSSNRETLEPILKTVKLGGGELISTFKQPQNPEPADSGGEESIVDV